MRFHLVARRITVAQALGLALVAAVAACSSSSSSSSTSTPSSSAPASSAAASSAPASSAPATSSASATAQITANWEAFFSGKTPAAKKIQLLQNGQTFASIIDAQAGSSLATSAAAKVMSVTMTSSTQAKVVYDITLSGATALSNQTGTAVYQGGTWKVGDASFCALLSLENGGKPPSVCSSVS
jgi:hypothetical protein